MINSDSVQTTLVGFAALPADTFAEGSQSGADNGNGEPISANGRTGPFDGQPVQGFSGVQFAPSGNGAFWFLSDNGFGAQSNSADYLLRLYQVDPNFAGLEAGDGSVEIEGFVQLSDPNNFIPFDIVNEDSTERFLTGGNFDIESFVIDNNGDIWIGDEFGPYILHFNSEGELLEAPISTPNITNFNTLNGQDPLVIAHRGASGVLPEHTLAAYATAIAQGADFIEPDLVTTKDGVLIARHEPILDNTTNVAEVFGEERKSTKILDREEITAYFAEDFTLEEIKMLRAVQPRPYRSQDFNDAFEIPTLQEVIELVQRTEATTGVKVGIYPETKHPTFFDLQGLSLEEPLIETLKETDFTDRDRIFIQSFEFQNLIELQGLLDAEGLGDIPLVQLYGNTTEDAHPNNGFSVPYDIRYNLEQGNDLVAIYGQEFVDAVEDGLSENTTYRDLDNPEILQIISEKYAEGAGPWKNNILLRESLDEPVDGNGDGVAEITTQLTGEITSFIEDAHDVGLQVHPYTHRNEERFLTLNPDGTPQTPESEIEQLVAIGADGFFTDFPGTGAAVVNSLAAEFVQSPQNPDLGDGIPNLSQSRGYEGMAFSPDRTTLYPLLEGVVDGDPENALRIYEFDVASNSFTGLVGYYPTTNGNPIGDFTPINDSEFLVIERDGGQGETAEFKKIFKINIDNVDENGFVEKTELVDLLNIADPNDLNGDGGTTFDFPFVTIEDVVVVDENTILVANDNNYPFSQGREGDIDNNEIILLELNEPLNLDPRLGGNAVTPTFIETMSNTTQPAQMTGLNGYEVEPIFTVGEKINDYAPPGILDGLGAFALDDDTVRVLANHELTASSGYAYTLANGTELTGARVSYFDIDQETGELEGAGLAYDTIINRAGEIVDEASDLEFEGINRLCSAQYIEAHQFGSGRGLEDAMFFTGEETSGGTEFVIDPDTNIMYAVPWMGRAAWESVTELDTGTTDKVALLVGDDREAAPLLLYVGEKDTSADAEFLARNGLSNGKLYVWKPDGEVADSPDDEDNAPDPTGFNGTGNSLGGTWVELDYYRPDLAGNGEYDELGFATQEKQDALFIEAGGFQFSRPEDLATNPEDGAVAVLASTGRGGRFDVDNWGTTYTVDTDFDGSGNPITAQIDIIYDGDDAGNGQFEHPDFGLRSPDNLEWADDGQIYVQEDRSTFADQGLSVEEQESATFGAISGEEASIWRIDPDSGILTRVAQMDRSAVPEGQTDSDPDDIGEWESSGIIDVSSLFDEAPGTRFIFGVQAHSLRDGIIETAGLVQGGQLAFLNNTPTFLVNDGDTAQPAQMTGLNGYEVDPFFTIGEQFEDYAPPGIPDGLGAFALDEDTVRVFANHELTASSGYTYTLANGTELTGARVSFFDLNKETLAVEDAGLAYDTIINRAGEIVDEASDLEFEGIQRLCSAQYIEAHQFGEGRGLEDAMFFTGEETFGGTEFVIDPDTNIMYAVPWMGRAAWESVTELDTGTTDKVALLVGDDREAAPLLLYVGEKDSSADADFLARNGLSNGKLYVWKPDGEVADSPDDEDNAPDPTGFNGTGNSLGGTWVELDYYRPDLANSAVDTDDDGNIQDELGYDELGFATQAQQDQLFIDAGGFQFSRPEDLATNPEDGTVAVLASTGRSGRFPEDSWGTTLTIDTDFDATGNPITAQVNILYDGDDAGNGQFNNPDEGLRSPDNLEWADDGQIYIQEDRSFGEFGLNSGEEASIWRIDPDSGELTRVAQMDRSAVPEGQTDGDPDDIGDWESSGIIDVSSLFDEAPGTRLIFGVQAHSLRDGIIETAGLVQGGQLAFLTREESETETTTPPEPFFGTIDPNVIEASGSNGIIFAGSGDDLIDLTTGEGNNRAYGNSGDDTFILGTEDRVFGHHGDDRFFVNAGGANTITGDGGADQFWIASVEIPESANTVTDFTIGEDVIGIAGLGISFSDLTFSNSDLGAVISVNDSQLAIFTNNDADSLNNEALFAIV